jgi:hypothetical protein
VNIQDELASVLGKQGAGRGIAFSSLEVYDEL